MVNSIGQLYRETDKYDSYRQEMNIDKDTRLVRKTGLGINNDTTCKV